MKYWKVKQYHAFIEFHKNSNIVKLSYPENTIFAMEEEKVPSNMKDRIEEVLEKDLPSTLKAVEVKKEKEKKNSDIEEKGRSENKGSKVSSDEKKQVVEALKHGLKAGTKEEPKVEAGSDVEDSADQQEDAVEQESLF